MKNQYLLIVLITIFSFTAGQLFGQCNPERHNTSWFNGWASCETSPNPNVVRGESHWILYNLKDVYQLGKTHVWNTNDPKHLDWGFKEITIDVSNDGISWIEVGTFNISEATGENTYEGETGPDLTDYEGQYVLLTAMSNHGGECFGLSEIRIEAEATTVISSVEDIHSNDCFKLSAFPNPFIAQVDVQIQANCVGELEYSVNDVLGKTVHKGTMHLNQGTQHLKFNIDDLHPGTYYLKARQGGYTAQLPLVKLNRT